VSPLLDAVSSGLARAVSAACGMPQLAAQLDGECLSVLSDLGAFVRGELESPAEPVLIAAVVSFPLIGLAQLVNFAVAAHAAGAASPAGLLEGCVGAAGHSQGVVGAAAAAACGGPGGLVASTLEAVLLLFWQSARMTEAFRTLPPSARLPPPAATKPGAPKPLSAGDIEGLTPTPMLSLSGAPVAFFVPLIAAVNATIAKVEKAEGSLKAAMERVQGGGAAGSSGGSGGSNPGAGLEGRPQPLTLSLVNGLTSVVVSGRPAHLVALLQALDAHRAPPTLDQSRTPFSQRKPVVRAVWLPVGAPFHSPLLAAAVDRACEDCAREGLGAALTPRACSVPVLSSEDGSDLRATSPTASAFLRALIELQCCAIMDWPRVVSLGALRSGAQRCIDFGPGGSTGGAKLTARLLQGAGIPIIIGVEWGTQGSAPPSGTPPPLLLSTEGLPIYSPAMLRGSPAEVPHWVRAHSPRLAVLSTAASTAAPVLDTAFARLTGRSPIMIAGMTPCTSLYGTDLVAASLNAGFHAELACGGLPRPSIFKSTIALLNSKVIPGSGIGLNMLFLNARQWAFQAPAVAGLIREGLPIETVCIAAGVPTLENAVGIVKDFEAAGVKWVSFKPGSLEAIRRVLSIAAAVAPYPVVLQWTGGRAGGHHSFEDVHAPMAAAYAASRDVGPSLVLVAGSGIGSADCALPWLTGHWAVTSGHSLIPMPFDGVLVASRVMVAKETRTAHEVKELLVATPGIDRESEWEGSYEGEAGGILTARSELGEPIHLVANRGMRLWREFDKKFFQLPRGERPAAYAANRDLIVTRLNADFQKPYFGIPGPGAPLHNPSIPGGGVPAEFILDASKMTYSEVAQRMVELMFVLPSSERPEVEAQHEDATAWGRWVHPSYRDRVHSFLLAAKAAVESCRANALGSPGPGEGGRRVSGKQDASLGGLLASPAALDPGAVPFSTPSAALSAFFGAYPEAGSLVLSASDFEAWLGSMKTGGKPVPFVPAIDADFEEYFKKDSLWYSEDLAAVLQRDAGRVCILQGPVAVKHSKIVNEPVGDILRGIERGLVSAVADLQQGQPTVRVEGLGGVFSPLPLLSSFDAGGLTVDPCAASTASAASIVLRAKPKASSAAVKEALERLLAGRLAGEGNGSSSPLGFLPAASAARILAVVASKHIVRLLTDSSEPVGGSTQEGTGQWAWSRNMVCPAILPVASQQALKLSIIQSSGECTLQVVEEGGSEAILVTCLLSPNALPSPIYPSSVRLPKAPTHALNFIFHDVRPATRDARSAPAPLVLTLYYTPSRSWSPLCLSSPSWDAEVKRYYASLWFSEDPSSSGTLDVSSTLTSTYTLTDEDCQDFSDATGLPCSVGTGGPPSFDVSARTSLSKAAPMPIAIVAAWKAIIRSLFPRAISACILDLVHLSNDFALLPPPLDAKAPLWANAPLCVGERVESSLCITRVANGPSGKTVTVEGRLCRNGAPWEGESAPCNTPWVAVKSSFLFRGAFSDHGSCFTRSPLPCSSSTLRLPLPDDTAIALLTSKPWFAMLPSAAPLVPGVVLHFTLTYLEKSTPRDPSKLTSVAVDGTAALEGSTDPVATVAYTFSSSGSSGGSKGAAGNVVLSFLTAAAAAGKSTASSVPLDTPYTLLPTPMSFTAPASTLPYATASRDLNPIHRSPVLAALAGLPGPITHGMWTSATGYLALWAAIDIELGNVRPGKDPVSPQYTWEAAGSIASYAASFTGMVFPGDELLAQVSHTGTHIASGRRVLSISLTAVRAGSGAVESVLSAESLVDMRSTAFVFTGQGSADVGMGMDLYSSSAVAKKVWDTAEEHLLKTFGFSILNIVRANPKTLTVNFGGRTGAAVRRNYRALTREALDGSGPEPLMPQITEDSESVTFNHPDGLLFATQFTQPALVLVEKAAFDDMRACGLIPSRAFLFAGHSLGEYAALSAAVPLLSVPTLVRLVFLRGLTMQGAVARDASGRSEFGMVACNPARVGPFLTEPMLHELVGQIGKHSNGLLELVNYNVAGRQYVVAGGLQALDTLGHVLTAASANPSAALEDPVALVKNAFSATANRVAEAAAAGKHFALERGAATIPLPGVDVPFHSTYLRGGVKGFRAVLSSSLTEETFSQPGMLASMLGCYIPNLVAMPFSLSREFACEVFRRTSTPILGQLLANEGAWQAAASKPSSLARLLVIELLAYQFASPVQWIDTQRFLFTGKVALPLASAHDCAPPPTTLPAFLSRSPALPAGTLRDLGFGVSALPQTGAPQSGKASKPQLSCATIRRMVELGPTLTLAGMAARSLETGLFGSPKEALARVTLLCFKSNQETLYWKGVEDAGPSIHAFLEQRLADKAAAEEAAAAAAAASLSDASLIPASRAAPPTSASPAPPPPPPSPPLPPPPSLPPPVAAVSKPFLAPASDEPVSPLEVIQVLLSVKLAQPLSSAKAEGSIKALVGGKSAVQNEIMGELEKEFGGGPEGGAEMTLAELGKAIGANYKGPGKVGAALITKVLSAKLPGGFTASAAREHLARARGLGPGRVEGVLLHAVTMAPEARLGSPSDAQAWLEKATDSYGAFKGVNLSAPSAGGAVGGGGLGGLSPELFAALLGGGGGVGGGGDAGGVAQPIPDSPASALQFIRTILCVKLAQPLAAIKPESSIKSLTGGKSAVQNEIMGELEKEFGGGPEGGAEMTLAELGKAIGTNYKGPGKVGAVLITKVLSAKLPGGFTASAAREFLAKERGLGPGTTDAVLLHAVTMAPEARLGSPSDAQAWLSKATDSFGTDEGINVSRRSGGGGGGGGGGGANLLALLAASGAGGAGGEKLDAKVTSLSARLAALLTEQVASAEGFLGLDSHAATRALAAEQRARQAAEEALALWRSEHAAAREDVSGDAFAPPVAYEAGIRPLFSPEKVREYKSAWAWGLQALHRAVHTSMLPCALLQADPSLAGEPAQRGERSASPPSSPLSGGGGGGSGGAKRSGRAWWESGVVATSSALMMVNRATPEAAALAASFEAMCLRAAASGAKALWAVPQPTRRRFGMGSVGSFPPPSLPPLTQPLPLSPLFSQPGSFATRRPYYLASFVPTAPRVSIDPQGRIRYAEVPRPHVPHARAYVLEMAQGAVRGFLGDILAPLAASHPLLCPPTPAAQASSSSSSSTVQPAGTSADSLPFIHMRTSDPHDSGGRVLDISATRALFSSLLSLTTDLPETVLLSSYATQQVAAPTSSTLLSAAAMAAAYPPVTFSGRTALVTGCGAGSIGIELIKALLAGGATVVATSSRFTAASTSSFRKVYQEWGASGSRLLLFPFNAGSAADVTALVAHLYGPLGLDLDYMVPFAAVGEAGREVEGGIDGASDLAHRIMLTNVLRLIGAVAAAKRAKGVGGRPALCLLPLSPNHGVFGGDGLYAESKLGLEALMHKWGSESWGEYIGITGAVIGWTRGTGLMSGNNISAEGVEGAARVRTFSQAEMALNLAALLHPRMTALAWEAPLWADLRGGFNTVADLKGLTMGIRTRLEKQAKLQKALTASAAKDSELVGGGGAAAGTAPSPSSSLPPRVYTRLFEFPPLPSEERLHNLSQGGALTGMVDLDATVCAVGFGELGPWGSARTRWEMEAQGEFSLEGCILLAWLTGRIKWVAGSSSVGGGAAVGGWADSASGAPIGDVDVKARYEAEILAHCGIRIVEPELFKGYDPHGKGKVFMHTVALERDMAWMEVAGEEEAREYTAALGDGACDVSAPSPTTAPTWRVRLRKGATISVPKALRFDRWVAGQIPSGWDAVKAGVPADLAARMDPVALYSLYATAEALVCAGISDPYEFYAYVHVSEVGNSCGGGMGGMSALQRIFYGRRCEEDMASDVLQESFINTVPAWINMLLLSSSGPIRTVVGACATAAESVDVACDALLTGRAKVMIVGGYDDFCEEGSYEFAQMGATSSSAEEAAAGRDPREACRPMAPTRGGFMEAQGSGIQILTTARLALTMGLPIYGVIAFSSTATDKVGRSVPAPGQGVLTTAREAWGDTGGTPTQGTAFPSPLLEVPYRRRRLEGDMEALQQWRSREEEEAAREAATLAAEAEAEEAGSGRLAGELVLSMRLSGIAREASMVEASARRRWCSKDFAGRDGSIAPLRAALSMFGMGVDDITAASFHGTGTAANDVNESRVTHTQMAHLGRTPGQPLYVVAQKHLTGHPKGAAAAWMLNGALQMLSSGIVPGNANGDDIDEELRPFTHLAFLSAPLPLGAGGVRAVLLKSFGFGQAGGEILAIHPDYLLASVAQDARAAYALARASRERSAGRTAQDILSNKRTLLLAKSAPPYTKAQEAAVYLNPLARATLDPSTGSYSFRQEALPPPGQGTGASCQLPPLPLPSTTSLLRSQLTQGLTSATAASPSPAKKAPAATPPALPASPTSAVAAAAAAAASGSAGASGSSGLGVDVEPISTFFPFPSPTLAERNYTMEERVYCEAAASPSASYAGRWAAKEAVVKALSSAVANGVGGGAAAAALQEALRGGAGAPLIDIEILPRPGGGAPSVRLHGAAAKLAACMGIPSEGGIRLSISHAAEYAVAVAAL
jgi:fatty acid synthase subunit alpha